MDTTTINQLGYNPIKPLLARIESINDLISLQNFVAGEAKASNTSIIGFYVGPDNKNSNLNIAHVYQAGISLPERDYYFKTDPSSVGIQKAFKTYLASLFTLSGSDSASAKKQADIVYNIEKQMASSHKTNIELRDVNANYNKMAVAGLAKRQPNIGWVNVLNVLGAKTDSIDVGQPAYYDKLNALLLSIPLSDWKVYLKASSMGTYAHTLSKPFLDAQFEFTRVLSGQTEQKSRGELMAANVDQALGGALGHLYVKKYFPEAAKKRALELVNNLQQALAVRIDKLDWMSDSTKEKSKEKLFAITKKIGYPDKWRDYSNITIVKGNYFENVVKHSAKNVMWRISITPVVNKYGFMPSLGASIGKRF